jgi:hypothetical protein
MQVRLLTADQPLELGNARLGLGQFFGARHPAFRPRPAP